jgi:hypothetical protein
MKRHNGMQAGTLIPHSRPLRLNASLQAALVLCTGTVCRPGRNMWKLMAAGDTTNCHHVTRFWLYLNFMHVHIATGQWLPLSILDIAVGIVKLSLQGVQPRQLLLS